MELASDKRHDSLGYVMTFVLWLGSSLCSSQVVSEPQVESLDNSPSVHDPTHGSRSIRLLRDCRKLQNQACILLKADVPSKASENVEYTLDLVRLLEKLRARRRAGDSEALRRLELRTVLRLRAIEKQTRSALRRRKRKPQKIEIRSDVLAQLNAAVGNPPGPNQPNANQDYGPLLVDLIQNTISPQSWDVRGGASSVSYWRPGRALVVRAPQAIHNELGPVMQQLRQQ